MNVVIGIDPGVSGGMAAVDVVGREVLCAESLRHFDRTGKILNGRVLKGGLVTEFIEVFMNGGKGVDVRVVVERQQFMKKHDFGTGGFAAAFNYGVLIESVWRARGSSVPVVDSLMTVLPAKWKREMGLSSDKELSRIVADAVFPGAGGRFWKRKGDDGIAEAALLAWYGAKVWGLTVGDGGV